MSETKPQESETADHWKRGANIWAVAFAAWIVCVAVYEAMLANAQPPEAWVRRIVMAVLAVIIPFVVLAGYRQVEAEDEAEKKRAKIAALEMEIGRLRAQLGLPEREDPSAHG